MPKCVICGKVIKRKQAHWILRGLKLVAMCIGPCEKKEEV